MRPKNLVRNDEIKRVVNLAQELGLTISAIDVRTDGVTVHTVAPTKSESSYDRWKNEQNNNADGNRGHMSTVRRAGKP